jgi:hypothetical protein
MVSAGAPLGGFSRYAAASHLAAHPPKTIDKELLARFAGVDTTGSR